MTLRLDYEPHGVIENIGDALGLVSRRVEGDLQRFKAFVESRGSATGAWRGEIHGGQPERGGAAERERAVGDRSGGTTGGSRETDVGGGLSGGMRSGTGPDASGGTGGGVGGRQRNVGAGHGAGSTRDADSGGEERAPVGGDVSRRDDNIKTD